MRLESGELVAVFTFAFRDEETASDAERDIDDDLGLLVHDPEIEIEGALVIAMSPVKGGDFGLNRLGLLEFIVRERSELTPGPTPEAAPLRSGDDHGEDTLPTPPEKTELKYSNLGSKLDRLIGRIEAGEISALDAAGNAPIHQDESVAVTIYLSGNAKAVVDFLKQNGGEVGNVGDDYIEAYVPVLLLGKTSEQPGVLRVREIIPPHQTHGDSTSQGVSVHGSQAWNQEGYKGPRHQGRSDRRRIRRLQRSPGNRVAGKCRSQMLPWHLRALSMAYDLRTRKFRRWFFHRPRRPWHKSCRGDHRHCPGGIPVHSESTDARRLAKDSPMDDPRGSVGYQLLERLVL